MEEGIAPSSCQEPNEVDKKSAPFAEKSNEDVIREQRHQNQERVNAESEVVINRKSGDFESALPGLSTKVCSDAVSVDSASSIGAISSENSASEGGGGFIGGDSDDCVSADSGRMTVHAEENGESVSGNGETGAQNEDGDAGKVDCGAKDEPDITGSCNAGEKLDSARSSPESEASSSTNDEVFGRDGSPNDPVAGASPELRRRTVSFIEDHRAESTAEVASIQDPATSVESSDPAMSASVDNVSTTSSVSNSSIGEPKMFRVAYLGNSIMDRRYPTDLQPWVMAELRRIGTTTPVVLSAISGGSMLHASPKSSNGPSQVAFVCLFVCLFVSLFLCLFLCLVLLFFFIHACIH